MARQTNAVTAERKPPIVALREKLVERRGELQAALTDIDPDHFIRALVTSAQVTPGLQECSFQSLWLACMRACRDNLLPDGREGAIVPYKDKATWIPMYQGLLKRFRQSGECKWITSDVVREGETFEHWVDQTGEHFKHVPEGDESKPIERVYAAALTRDGAFYVAVMSIAEINKIKAMSRAGRDDSPWKIWAGEMMKKTALRRLSKLLPAGRDVFEDEDDDDRGEQMSGGDIDRQRLSSMNDALDMLAAKPMEKNGGAVDEIDDTTGEVLDQGEYAESDDELPLGEQDHERHDRA